MVDFKFACLVKAPVDLNSLASIICEEELARAAMARPLSIYVSSEPAYVSPQVALRACRALRSLLRATIANRGLEGAGAMDGA